MFRLAGAKPEFLHLAPFPILNGGKGLKSGAKVWSKNEVDPFIATAIGVRERTVYNYLGNGR
jgi:hypothetical protein